MDVPSVLAVGLVTTGLAGHLWGEATQRSGARGAFKVAASLAFVALGAISAHDRFGTFVLAALCLSAVGDALLLSAARGPFLAGIGAFLVAHLVYAAAFARDSTVSPLAAVLLAAASTGTVAWLWRRLGAFRLPVIAYTAAISGMLLLGLGSANPLVPWGALLFYLSDVYVARDRFVRPGLVNRLVGLPLYYGAQVILALATRA